MNYGISMLALIPLRAQPDETSEMTSQILFGEPFEILKETENWVHVKLKFDQYTGWIDKKMCAYIQPATYLAMVLKSSFVMNTKFNTAHNKVDGSIHLSIGSILPFYNNKNHSFCIEDKDFILENPIMEQNKPFTESVIQTARIFLNSPYLWGGKSPMGIDCSGLTQIVYLLHNIILPRDAKDQVNKGIEIRELSEVKPGDLAFFENSGGEIIHVGILINASQIIHASGKVKIENFDSSGIVNQLTGKYSHKLSAIKRIYY
ncbi:MAG: C40 family peptidase [Bacteroidales bacterium]|nr:C40 family peptidase [Bacteroidales bacterium]